MKDQENKGKKMKLRNGFGASTVLTRQEADDIIFQALIKLDKPGRETVVDALLHFGEMPMPYPIEALKLCDAVLSILVFPKGNEKRDELATAYGLSEEQIATILEKTGVFKIEEEDRRDESKQPLLPFKKADGTPEDLDALEMVERFDADSAPHLRGKDQVFGISKVLQLSHRVMNIPTGQLTASQGFNVARPKREQIIVSVTWELAKELSKDFRLTFFDMRVENAAYNLWADGQPKPTLKQIVRELDFMEGDQDASEERCKMVFESLKRLSILKVDVDFTEQMKQMKLAKPGAKYTIGGMAVPLRWGKIERNGREQCAVKILDAPIFTAYSKAANQAVTVPRSVMTAATVRQMDEKGNYIEGTGTLSNTQVVGDYRYFLAHQLKRIANTGNHKILFDTIFEETGDTVPKEKTANGRKTRSKRKEIITKLLDAWQAVGFIKSWKITKSKTGAEDGVEIMLPTNRKELQ